MKRFISIFLFVFTCFLSALSQSASSNAFYDKAIASFRAGKYEEALAWFEKTLEIDKQENPNHNELIGADKHWVAHTLYLLKRNEEAKKYMPDFYEIEPADRYALKDIFRYSQNVADATSPDMVITWLNFMLDEEKKVFGEDHPSIFNTYSNLAYLYFISGDEINCIKYINLAKEQSKKIKVSTSSWQAAPYAMECSIFASKNDIEAADKSFDIAWNYLNGDVTTYPTIYTFCLSFYINKNLHISNNINAAFAEVSRAYDELMKADDETFINCSDIINTIAEYGYTTGQAAMGLELTKRWLETTDEGHNYYKLFRCHYGRLLGYLNQHNKSFEILNELLKEERTENGTQPELWVDLLMYTQAEADMIRQYDIAAAYLKEALSIFKKYAPGTNNRIIECLHKLAAISTRTNNYRQSIDYLEDAIKIMNRLPEVSNYDIAFINKELASCYAVDNKEKAAEHFNIALELLKEPKDYNECVLYSDCMLAFLMLDLTDSTIPDKIAELEKIVLLYDANADFLKIKLKGFLSSYYLSKYDSDTALKQIDEAVEIASRIPEYNMYDVLSKKCSILMQKGDYDSAWEIADKLYNEALKNESGNELYLMNIIGLCSQLADFSFSLEWIAQFSEMSDRVLEYTKKLAYKDPAYLDYSLLAASMKQFSDSKMSKEIASNALKNTPKSTLENVPYSYLNALRIICECEYRNGNFEDALSYIPKIEKLIKKIGPSISYVTVYDLMGRIFNSLNLYADAEKIYLEGIQMVESVSPQHPILILLYQNIAQVYSKIGQISKYEEFLSKYNRLAGNFNNSEGYDLATNYSNAVRYMRIGLFDESEKAINVISDYVENHPDGYIPKYLPYYLNALKCYFMGDYAMAAFFIDEVLRYRDIKGDVYDWACEIYNTKGEYENGLKAAERLEEMINSSFPADAMERILPPKRKGDAYFGLKDINNCYINYEKAFRTSVKFLNNNLLTLTSNQRADYWNSNSFFYMIWLPKVASENSFPAEMNGLVYDATLFSNGLLLNADQSIYNVVQKSSPQIKDLYSQYTSRKENLNRVLQKYNISYDSFLQNRNQETIEIIIDKRDEVNAAQSDVEAIERDLMAKLREAHPEALKYNNYTWQDVKRKLPKNAAAVEYLDFPCSPDSNSVAALVLRKDFEFPVLKVLYRYPRNRSFDIESTYTTTELGDCLVDSLDNLLGDCTDVYFAPHGMLCTVALESLPRSRSDAKPLNLYRVSSTAILADKKFKRKDFKASLFGGLSYDMSVEAMVADTLNYPAMVKRDFVADNIFRAKREGDIEIPELPGTLKEIETINTLLSTKKKVSPTVKTGNQGTETAFKALSGKYGSILHIGTHGFFNADSTYTNSNLMNVSFEDQALERSGLLLAGAANRYVEQMEIPDNIDDGILKSSEIAKLDLSGVDLAVLSACETGLGAVTGDGVFGLQRGFKKAGVNSILMSLWKVDDDATSVLINEFYSQWLSENIDKYRALELAKEKVRQNPKWKHPKFWAAFILLDGINE